LASGEVDRSCMSRLPAKVESGCCCYPAIDTTVYFACRVVCLEHWLSIRKEMMMEFRPYIRFLVFILVIQITVFFDASISSPNCRSFSDTCMLLLSSTHFTHHLPIQTVLVTSRTARKIVLSLGTFDFMHTPQKSCWLRQQLCSRVFHQSRWHFLPTSSCNRDSRSLAPTLNLLSSTVFSSRSD
jgi:hypothetical protein